MEVSGSYFSFILCVIVIQWSCLCVFPLVSFVVSQNTEHFSHYCHLSLYLRSYVNVMVVHYTERRLNVSLEVYTWYILHAMPISNSDNTVHCSNYAVGHTRMHTHARTHTVHTYTQWHTHTHTVALIGVHAHMHALVQWCNTYTDHT